MDSGEWNNVLNIIQRKGVLMNENVLMQSFTDVVNKAFDPDMGFGYISENGYTPKAKVILQGKNPFMDNQTGTLSPVMEDHLPYSQVYHLAWGGEEVTSGRTLCILRHYLHVPSLSENELASIKVAACSLENMDSIKYKSEGENGVMEKKFSIKEEITVENYSSTNEILTEKQKAPVTFSVNENQVERKPLQKKSTQMLLEQMNQIVRPMANATAESLEPGQVVVTVHKASDIEKKGLVGKADPYVVVTYGTQTEKSATVDNNHNPVWHVTGYFDVEENSTSEITFEVFDEDVGKDDALGKAIINIQDVLEASDFVNKLIPLENCKSGKILISAKFVPLQKINRAVGEITLTVHKAKKIGKKSMMKKADPYVLIKLGKDQHKSETVSNNQNPTWNYSVNFDVIESSPRQISFEVFDDDIGKDATLGNITLDVDTIMKKQKLDNFWTRLENCKSGELLISAKFMKAPIVEEDQYESKSSVVNIKKESVTETIDVKQVQKMSVTKSTTVATKQSHFELEKYQQEIEFVDPIYRDNEFVVVEKNTNNWFMVVSKHDNLPINVSIVPFKKTSEPHSPIFIYPLPKGGFHNIKRVVHSGKGLKKCGYEKPCVLRAGEPYQFWSDAQGQNFNHGNLTAETFGPDKSWVVYKEEYFKPQDYIEVTLSSDENGPEFSGPISLYDRLNVEAA